MLSIQTDKKLNIILPNNNKILAKFINSASPSQLDTISRGKDLKSILHSLLKDSSINSQSNKTLLTLVQSNSTFNELKDLSKIVKDLTSELKLAQKLEPAKIFIDKLQNIEKSIKILLPDIKEIKSQNIKSSVENSGIFFESKIKNIEVPQKRLVFILKNISKQLQKSELSNIQDIKQKISKILSFTNVQNSTKDINKQTNNEPVKILENISKEVKILVKKLMAEIKFATPITSEKFINTLDKSEKLIQTNYIKSDSFKIPILIENIKDINTTLKTVFTNNSRAFIDKLTKVIDILQNIKYDIEQKTITTTQGATQILEKKIDKKINTIITNIKIDIQKTDPIFSKEIRVALKELTNLTSPQKLSFNEHIKELLSNDLKSILSKAKEDITNLPTNNKENIIKHLDKLSSSIDYYQLISHLSNSSTLYIPITWDSMKEGSINIKKVSQDKFYCDIELYLKEYKELKLRLSIFDKNQLNIYINSDSTKLKKIMSENLSDLRKSLISLQINPREIRFAKYTRTTNKEPYHPNQDNFNIGFEVKA